MSELKLKALVGSMLVLSHFFLIILIIFLYFMNGFAFEEMTTAVSLVVPLFAGYTSAILAYVVKSKFVIGDDTSRVNFTYAAFSLFVPSVFSCLLFSLVIIKAYNFGFETFEQFKIMIAVVEGSFGVYVGQFIHSMYGRNERRRARPRPGRDV